MWVVNLRPIGSDRRVCQLGAAGGSMADRCVSACSRGGRTSSAALFLTLQGVTSCVNGGNEDHFSLESLVKIVQFYAESEAKKIPYAVFFFKYFKCVCKKTMRE